MIILLLILSILNLQWPSMVVTALPSITSSSSASLSLPLSTIDSPHFAHRRSNRGSVTELPPTSVDSESSASRSPSFANHIDPKELLQVKIINKSVNYYKTQFKRVRTSLQDQLNEFITQIKGIKFESQFSPELQQKLNETFLKFIDDLELSPYCLASFNHLRLEIQNKRLWPLKFIDAMEFIPTGALEGVMSMFGLYEECINIESPMAKWNDIRGKYCMAKVKLPFLNPSFMDPSEIYDPEVDEPPTISTMEELNSYHGKKMLIERMNKNFDLLNNKLKMLQMINMFNGSHLRIGLCFPSTCSSFELERAINKFLDPLNNPLHVEIEEECSYKGQEIQLDNHQMVAMLILTALGLVIGGCTAYEYYMTHFQDKDEVHKSQYDSYLISFSAISNTRHLLSDEQKRLCAVDTLMMMFVLMEMVGRSYVLPIFYGMMNIKRPLNGLPSEYFTAKKFFFIRGSSFAVSTYILTSAIMLAYNICAYKPHIKPTLGNYLKFVLLRYLSLIRRLIGPILLIYLMPLVGDGPIWHYFSELYVQPCKNNLLSTLLFYNNYANSFDEVCLQPSVIVSALFVMSLAAPILLYALNHQFYGNMAFILLIIIGSIVSVIPKFVFNLPVTPYEISSVSSVPESKLSFIHYYAATDQLIVVFTIGLFIGYLIKCKPKIDLGKRATNVALWVGMLALPVVSTSWNEGFKPLEGNFSQFSFTAWFILSKIMWSLGFGWIVFTCCTGRAQPMNEVMSLSLIRPIGKLAFGAYLNHVTILSFRQLTKIEPTPLNHIEILTNDISDIVIAFAVSYVFYILIERPFYYWIRIVFQLHPEQPVKRFSICDLENGKLNDKEETIDLKPLNSSATINNSQHHRNKA